MATGYRRYISGRSERFGVLRLCPDKYTAETIGVPVQELGGGVHHNVRPKCQWLLQRGREERVVNTYLNATCVTDLSDSADVSHSHHGIRGRLDVYQLGLGS